MFELDEMAYASRCRNWSPSGKFLFALSLLIVSLLSQTLLVPITVLMIGLSLLIYSSDLRFPRILALILLDSFAVILVGAFVLTVVTVGDPVFTFDLILFRFSMTDGGIATATLVTTRALAGMTVMLFFATSTPIPHFSAMLARMKMPKEITELMVMIYRYSFLLFDEMVRMHTAAECRLGFRSIKVTLRTYAKIAVGVFIRSLNTAERINIGLQCRNYQNEMRMLWEPKRMGLTWSLLIIVNFTALLALNIWCQDIGFLTW